MRTSFQDEAGLCGALWRMTLVLLTLGLSSPALASLGGSLGSVQSDQSQMRATAKIAEGVAYTVHEIKAPTGTVVKEYVSPAGRVFGVSWRGPFIPDMQQLLGDYFEQYSAAAKAQREGHVGLQPLNIQEPGLVIQTAGHMRAYSGRAYDPGLLPAGVTPNDVR